MSRQAAPVLYAVALAVVICRVDFAFLRNSFRKRFLVEADIVLVQAALPPRGIWKGRLSLISHCLARIAGMP
jgi:hypothetical protein